MTNKESIHTARLVVQSMVNHPATVKDSPDERALRRTLEILKEVEDRDGND